MSEVEARALDEELMEERMEGLDAEASSAEELLEACSSIVSEDPGIIEDLREERSVIPEFDGDQDGSNMDDVEPGFVGEPMGLDPEHIEDIQNERHWESGLPEAGEPDTENNSFSEESNLTPEDHEFMQEFRDMSDDIFENNDEQ